MVRLLNVLLAIGVSIGLAVLLFEVGLRLIGFAPPAINTEFDPQLGWRGIPNSKITNSGKEFDAELELDALGLRDDFTENRQSAKKRGVYRLLFLGDSFVNGYTVDREDLFVDRLERAWAEENRAIEIVNAGIQGYSTDQQLRWLELNGETFAPDLVVLFPYENDIWWNGSETYVGEPKPMYDDDGVLATDDLEEPPPRTWFEKTAIGALPRRFESAPTIEVDGSPIGVEYSSRLTDPPSPTRAAERRTRVLVQKIRDTATAFGARFAVCPIPSKAHVYEADTEDALDPARPYEIFAATARSMDTHLIDVVTDLRAAVEEGRSPYYDYDFHLNAVGNGVLARSLYEEFERHGMVPAGDPDARSAAPSPDDAGSGLDLPAWPLWYLGLLGVLGTLYARTYPDESTGSAFFRVGLLLAVVFATALGVSALVAGLPPLAGKILLVGLIVALLTFVAYKLGSRIGTIAELLKSFTLRGHWYLMPLLSVLLTVGSLLVVAASSPLVAPFIYTLF